MMVRVIHGRAILTGWKWQELGGLASCGTPEIVPVASSTSVRGLHMPLVYSVVVPSGKSTF